MSLAKELAYLIGFGVATGREAVNTVLVSTDGKPAAQCPKLQKLEATRTKENKDKKGKEAKTKDGDNAGAM